MGAAALDLILDRPKGDVVSERIQLMSGAGSLGTLASPGFLRQLDRKLPGYAT